MKFGPAPLAEAKGAIMAHSQKVGERMIRKGSLLDDAAIETLRAAGRLDIICARLEPGDVPEDIAADRLATPLVSPLIARSRAATGRVNLMAEVPGLLRIDTARIDRLNTIDEAMTIGTLPDYAVVAPKDLVATVKIVPFSVPGTVLSVAETMARQGNSPLSLHPFRHLKVGLVVTELPGLKESVTDKTIAITEARVSALTGSLLPPVRCAHHEEAIGRALDGLVGSGADLLLVIGASAVVDRRDVGPQGIVRAGGEILHFGMPVDPGNLICLGRIGDKPALVLPGCARSPSLNGIDFVLTRLFAGVPVTPRDMMRMGVGGLLKEMETRPMPREKATTTPRSGAAPRTNGGESPFAWPEPVRPVCAVDPAPAHGAPLPHVPLSRRTHRHDDLGDHGRGSDDGERQREQDQAGGGGALPKRGRFDAESAFRGLTVSAGAMVLVIILAIAIFLVATEALWLLWASAERVLAVPGTGDRTSASWWP